MNDSYPTPWSDPTSSSLTPYDEQAPGVRTDLPERGLQGKWLPIILVSLFFLSSWLPSSWPTPELKWYMVFSLAIVAFLAQGVRLDMRAAQPFWVVYGLSFAGALISLLRAPNFDRAQTNTVGFGVNLVIFILFIPVLATRLTRRVILMVLIFSAILWTFEIQRLVSKYGTLILSSLSETGGNRNAVGIILTLAGTALFYLAAFWRPSKIGSLLQLWIMRLVFGLAGLFLFYNLVLIYDRSGLFEATVGIGAVLGAIWIKSPRKFSGLIRVALVVSVLILAVILVLPRTLETAPVWEPIYERTLTEGIDSFGRRELLLRKGWYLVGQNPFLGVGIGGTKDAIYSIDAIFPYYFVHNMYLTDWAEKGILGLFSYIVLILIYLRFVKVKFFNLPIADQIWLLLFIPLSFALLFKDMNTLHIAIVAIITGIIYEQYQLERTEPENPVSPNIGV